MSQSELYCDEIIKIVDDAFLLPKLLINQETEILGAIESVSKQAPFRHMITPGGYKMSVAMTNCGSVGWVTDRKGYRYSKLDPETGLPWPEMPALFLEIAKNAAIHVGFKQFVPDACLINRYATGARMALHQDKNEQDAIAPIVSISLGLPVIFMFGGLHRTDKPQRIKLEHADVVVWGGSARFNFHGIVPVKAGHHAILGNQRINLTFRKALAG